MPTVTPPKLTLPKLKVKFAMPMIRPTAAGIRFTGLRPGEKLYEELIADSDQTLPTRISRVRIAKLGHQHADQALLEWVKGAMDNRHWAREEVVGGLKRWVSEYGVPVPRLASDAIAGEASR